MEYFFAGFFVIVLPIWLMASIFVSAVAWERGRNMFGWFILAMIYSPLFALACLATCPVRPNKEQRESMIDCPDCAEAVKAAAKVCRHCGFRWQGASAKEGASSLFSQRVQR